ncbi:ABC transporter ATP-binding protein [Methanobacterium sp. SMA-27]|uniref:ABC transporter ATP-binding protein n=1 Tax=Methanobacterium sp. SMA-27 TaxID=1495336 RepID=UPI00064F842B|nr:ABC transporter ATP-binding protein [Methanobacterium sp. SMA-27]
MPLLEIENIFKEYDGKNILENINLRIKRGTTLGIIGPTGCGKTTLLRIVDLIEKPSSGKIYLDGKDVSKSNMEELNYRRKIGMVFQKPVVFKGTVLENIQYGLNIRGLDAEPTQYKINEILESLGLEGYEDRKASSLSGGEIQRIALARAMIIEPEILMLDEPTANLDPLSTEKIEEMIEEIRNKNETTIIMSTHNLIQGQRLCDEIAIINHRIHQIGKPEDIFRRPQNSFVAEFVGMKNVIKGQAKKFNDNLTLINIGAINVFASKSIEGNVYMSIRPEDITISKLKVETSALNDLKGIVKGIVDDGTLIKLKVDVGEIFTVYLTRKSFFDLEISIGSNLWLQFKASAVNVFK